MSNQQLVVAVPSELACTACKTVDPREAVVQHILVLQSRLQNHGLLQVDDEQLQALQKKLLLIAHCQCLGKTIKGTAVTFCHKIYEKYVCEPGKSRRLCYYNQQHFEKDLQALHEVVGQLQVDIKQLEAGCAPTDVLQSLQQRLELEARDMRGLQATAAKLQELPRQMRDFCRAEEEVSAQLRGAEEQVKRWRVDLDSNTRRAAEIQGQQQRLQQDMSDLLRNCPAQPQQHQHQHQHQPQHHQHQHHRRRHDANTNANANASGCMPAVAAAAGGTACGEVTSAQVGVASSQTMAVNNPPELAMLDSRLAELRVQEKAASSLVIFITSEADDHSVKLLSLLHSMFEGCKGCLLPWDWQSPNHPYTNNNSNYLQANVQRAKRVCSNALLNVTGFLRVAGRPGRSGPGQARLDSEESAGAREQKQKAPLSAALRDLKKVVAEQNRPLVVLWDVEAYCVDKDAARAAAEAHEEAHMIYQQRCGQEPTGLRLALLAIYERTPWKQLRCVKRVCRQATPESRGMRWHIAYRVERAEGKLEKQLKNGSQLQDVVRQLNLAEKRRIEEKIRVTTEQRARLLRRASASREQAGLVHNAHSCVAVEGNRLQADRWAAQEALQAKWEEDMSSLRERQNRLEDEAKRLTEERAGNEAMRRKLAEEIPALKQKLESVKQETAKQESLLLAKQDVLLSKVENLDHVLAALRNVQHSYRDLMTNYQSGRLRSLRELHREAAKLTDLCLGSGNSSWDSFDERSKEDVVSDVMGYYESVFGVSSETPDGGPCFLQQIIELTRSGDQACTGSREAAAQYLCAYMTPPGPSNSRTGAEKLCHISLNKNLDALHNLQGELKASLSPEEGACAGNLVGCLAQDFKEVAKLVTIKNQASQVKAVAKSFRNS